MLFTCHETNAILPDNRHVDIETSITPPIVAAPRAEAVASGFMIELVEVYGEWFVRTVRSDRTIALSRFESEGFASSHAETERARLGVGSVFKV